VLPEHATSDVAVVIATRNRETRLAFALEALASQTFPADRFEVVVVRAPDSSEPMTSAPPGLRVRFLRSDVAGPAAQRNLGWRAASAPLIAFTDDDCRPAPDWLERLHASQAGPETMLQGRTEPDPQEEHLYWGLARSWRITQENGWFATCNMAYPRNLLERLYGFDERFPSAWGEDTDLGLRAMEHGARQIYVDEALTWHAVLPRTLPAALREARRRDATVVVVARHPRHREELYLGHFAHPRHLRLLVALLGLAISRRWRPALALGAAPYVLGNVDRDHLTARGLVRQAQHLPARAALDFVVLVVIARAALRERVPLL
jgi:GT2 family glycosyltransferase